MSQAVGINFKKSSIDSLRCGFSGAHLVWPYCWGCCWMVMTLISSLSEWPGWSRSLLLGALLYPAFSDRKGRGDGISLC